MRIEGWYIDGFGIFRDHEVRGLGTGLTVFHGPNEAGKSTLLAFLRGVLFGFPQGRSTEARYPPLRGGAAGGRLFLSDAHGTMVVERQPGRRGPATVRSGDGSELDEAELVRRLGGCDRQLFQSVFAFSLSELQDFENLSTDGVRDRIFSAGIAGAGRSARQVVAELERRADALLRQRSGPAWELAGRLQALDGELDLARAAAAEYPTLIGAEEAAQQRLAASRARVTAAVAESRRAELLVELWPRFSRRESLRAELAALPAAEGVGDDAEARLGEVLATVRHTAEARDQAWGERDRERRRVEELEAALDERLPALAAELVALHGELALLRERLAERPDAREARDRAARELDAALQRLGAGWDETRAKAFDGSIPRAEEVREREAALAGAAAAAADAERAATAAEAGEREAAREAEHLARALEDEAPPTIEELERADAQRRRARTALQEREAAAARRDQCAREADRAEWELREHEPGEAAFAVAPAVLAAASVLLAVLAAWVATRGEAVVATACGVLATALAAAALLLRRREARTRDAAAQRAGRLAERRAQIERVRAEQAGWQARVTALDAALAEAAAACALPTPFALADLDEAEGAAYRQREARRARDDASARLDAARQRHDERAAAAAGARAAASDTRAEQERHEAEWAGWKAQHGLPATLSPRGALEFFDSVDRARAAAAARDEADRRLRELDAAIEGWRGRTAAALAAAAPPDAPRPAGDADTLVPPLQELHSRAERDRELRSTLAGAREATQRCEVAYGTADARWRRAVAEQAALFGAAGVEDEPAFRDRIELHSRRAGLEQEIRALEHELDARLGRGDDADRLRAELESGRVAAWEEAAARAAAEAAEAAADEEDAVRDHHDARNRRIALEESADIPALETERAAVHTSFVEQVEEWRRLVAARGLVEATLRVFERERQPRVLAAAADTLGRITDGRYTAVQQDTAREGELRVVDGSGATRTTDELSRGTAEQLYLALRLGLVEEFAERAAALPLVMDDCFVNFDPGRAARVASALADVARRNQVLVFTCHRSTARLLGRAGAQLRRLGD